MEGYERIIKNVIILDLFNLKLNAFALCIDHNYIVWYLNRSGWDGGGGLRVISNWSHRCKGQGHAVVCIPSEDD